jgi:hypothetical protein
MEAENVIKFALWDPAGLLVNDVLSVISQNELFRDWPE